MKRFKLKYAPHFGMFEHAAGKDLLDQLQFMRDNGFVAFEDIHMANREIGVQEKIASKIGKLGMEMGSFIAYANFTQPAFVSGNKDEQASVLEIVKNAVEVANRLNTKFMMVLPGTFNPKISWDYQTTNCIDLLKRCAEILEPYGITMLLEPLNELVDHPGMFLTKISQAFQIVKAVNSPSCKILNDLYHQQITEGHLIHNLDMAWDEIVYIQVGDNPGRNEPTTGEINFKNIFNYLYERGFTGIVGMEHGNALPGKEGELAVIKTYREIDNF